MFYTQKTTSCFEFLDLTLQYKEIWDIRGFFDLRAYTLIFVLIALMLLIHCLTIQPYTVPLTIPAGALSSAGLDTIFVAKAALFFAILLLWTIFIGKLCKYWFKLPIIAGQIIGGILLGPSCISIARWPFFMHPLYVFDYATRQVYALVSSDLFIFFIVLLSSVFTISYLLWLAGYETDVKDLLKVGVPAVSAGIFGAIIPIIFCWLVLDYGWFGSVSTVQSIAMGLVFSATSVSIPVAMLFTANKMHLKSSQASLGAAIIDDILAVVLLSFFFITIQTGTFGIKLNGVSETSTTMGEAIVYMIVAFAFISLIGYYFIPPLIHWLKMKRYYYLIPTVANGVMLVYFGFAELVGGLAGITGAYFAGLFHRLGDSSHRAERVIAPFVNAVLLPLFLGSIGLTVDITLLNAHHWVVVGILVVVAIISKLLACFMAAGLTNLLQKENRWTLLESYLFGSSMTARGEVGLVIATILYGARLISADYYIIALVVIILTTIASPIMLSIGFFFVARQVGPEEYLLKLGKFEVFGTAQLFNIIIRHVEATKGFHATVQMSEGCKIISLEDQNIQITFCPDRGLIFEGDQEHIMELLRAIKEEMAHELERFSAV